MIKETKIFDHGFVRLIDFMGSDERILRTARISTGSKPSKGIEADEGLMSYLYRNEHFSPFEQSVFTFELKMPIFVMRQWIRHRTQSVNEYSGRYSEMIDEFYIPEQIYKQATSNHQGSGDPVHKSLNTQIKYLMESESEESYKLYKEWVDKGISKEQARMILPVNRYTQFFTTMNLRNLFHLLELRLDSHAQYEIRIFANAIHDLIISTGKFKMALDVFDENYLVNTLVKSLKNKYKNNYLDLIHKLENL